MEEKSWIMVVNNDLVYLNMVGKIISDYYNVTLATSGVQALRIMQRGRTPDLILLDFVMPGIEGYEAYEHIYSKSESSKIPIIILTDIAERSAELTGLNLGAQDFITKPFEREILLARIRLRLEYGKQARQLYAMRNRLLETGIDEDRFGAYASDLTAIEQEIARLIILGYNNYEIAMRLCYSQGYVKNITTIIYEKLYVHGRGELRKSYQDFVSKLLIGS
jgi:DNA-binding NarL/FixJ family response regulator